jgi:hypothetical protein
MAGIVDIKLDDDDDLAMENGDLVLIDGAEVTAQLIRIRLRIPLGDIQWDERVGLTTLLADEEDEPDFQRVRAEYTHVIATTPGVSRVGRLTFGFNHSTREMTIDGEAFDGSGNPIEIKETLILGGGA